MGAESTTYFDHADYGMNTGPSAVAIVDLLLQWLSPISVVDAGCGTGMFHKEFKKRGVDTILGLDGASTSSVFGPGKSNFQVVDLTEPLELDRGFDLALCLEVAEHLPESSADLLVKTLTDLAPLALFSAAHPGQGGQGHLNERWPVYWQRRFHQHGYVSLDLLRGRLCEISEVADFYRTNVFVFAEAHRAGELLENAEEVGTPDAYMRTYAGAISQDLRRQPWRELVTALAGKARRRRRV